MGRGGKGGGGKLILAVATRQVDRRSTCNGLKSAPMGCEARLFFSGGVSEAHPESKVRNRAGWRKCLRAGVSSSGVYGRLVLSVFVKVASFDLIIVSRWIRYEKEVGREKRVNIKRVQQKHGDKTVKSQRKVNAKIFTLAHGEARCWGLAFDQSEHMQVTRSLCKSDTVLSPQAVSPTGYR